MTSHLLPRLAGKTTSRSSKDGATNVNSSSAVLKNPTTVAEIQSIEKDGASITHPSSTNHQTTSHSNEMTETVSIKRYQDLQNEYQSLVNRYNFMKDEFSEMRIELDQLRKEREQAWMRKR